MKSKSVVLMVVSLGFGLIAAIGISQVMGNSGDGEAVVERGQVLLASDNLKVGDFLTEENVKIEHWPLEVIPEEAARDFEQISHRRITTRLSKSLPIMLPDTVNEKDYEGLNIPEGFKLVAIKVSAEQTFNGLLQPGDKVDIIGVVQVRNEDPNARNRTQTVSKTFLKNIEVYTVNGKLRNTGVRESDGGGNAIVGILVSEKQSELIVLVQKIAKLQLVLRGESDSEEETEIDDYGDFYKSVFGESNLDSSSASSSEAEQEPGESGDFETFTMRQWVGTELQQVEFVGRKRVSPTTSSSPAGSDTKVENNDSNDYDQSREIESGLEEDQYPGE